MDSSAGQSTSFTPRGSGVRVPLRPHQAFVFELIALAFLTAIAAGLRLWQLGQIPPGLHVDEAFNLIDAREVAAGWRPVFLPANAGREVFYTYWQAALMFLFGDSIAVMRSASAFAGTLAVPATWLAARSLAPVGTSARTVALLSAALVAGSYWHLHFSRFGIRAVLFTPFVASVAWAWWRTLKAPPERALRNAALAGALLGLAVYVHPAGRGLFAVPLAHALMRRVFAGDREALRRAAICGAVMLAVASPLLWYWIVHPSLFMGHAGEVSIVGAGVGGVAANLAAVLGSFNIAGDPARWRNLPGRPAFDVAAGAAFLVGIVLAFRAARRGDDGALLTLIWFSILLIPSIVTDAAPNFSRAIGALPAACLLSAIGLERACAWIGRRQIGPAGSGPPAKAIAMGVMLAVPLYGGLRAARDYFQMWAPNPETAIAFDADIRDLAEWTLTESEREGSGSVLLSPETASHSTVRAITHGHSHAPVGVDTTRGLVLRDVESPDPRLAGTYVYLERLPWEARYRDALMQRVAEDERAFDVELDAQGGREVRHVRALADDLTAAHQVFQMTPFVPVFDDAILLAAAQDPGGVTPGDPIKIRFVWKAAGPTVAPLHTAVQLVDDQGELVASGDARPLGGEPSTDRWQGGEWIIADHELEWIEDRTESLLEGDWLSLRIGWYRLEPDAAGALQPVTVPEAHGDALVTIGRIRVGRAR